MKLSRAISCSFILFGIFFFLARARSEDKDPFLMIPGVPLPPYNVTASEQIGIIDSGVDQNHPQIANSVGAVRDFTGEGLADSIGHGTKIVLEFIYLHYNELSRDSKGSDIHNPLKKMAVAKVISSQRASAQVVANRVVEAIKWIVELKIRLINITIAMADKEADYNPLCAKIAESKDVIFVISAGNSGPDSIEYPAACSSKNIFVVGAGTPKTGIAPYSGHAEFYAPGSFPLVSVSEYWRQRGDTLFIKKLYSEARQAYERGFEANTDAKTAGVLAYDIGAVSLSMNEDKNAREFFEKSIGLFPSFPQTYCPLGALLARQGDYEAEKNLLLSGLEAGADTVDVHECLARTFMDLDRPKDTLTQISEIERREPNRQGIYRLKIDAQNIIIIEEYVKSGKPISLLLNVFCLDGDLRLVKLVVKRWHPDLNQVANDGYVLPLVVAAWQGFGSITSFLIDSGAIVDGRDPKNLLTALMAAAATGREDICKYLIQRGATLDLKDSSGYTALIFAVTTGHEAVVKILLDSGAKTSIVSEEGLDAIGYAKKHKFKKIIYMLINANKKQ